MIDEAFFEALLADCPVNVVGQSGEEAGFRQGFKAAILLVFGCVNDFSQEVDEVQLESWLERIDPELAHWIRFNLDPYYNSTTE